MNQHMSVSEYRQLVSAGGSTLPKTPKVSDNICPLEKVECQRFSMKLTELVNMGLVAKYSHIANESSTKAMNIRNQRVGVRSGCPDFVIVLKDKVVFVEMKRVKGGTVSEEQKQWIAAINAAGGYATVARGAAQAIEYLSNLIEK